MEDQSKHKTQPTARSFSQTLTNAPFLAEPAKSRSVGRLTHLPLMVSSCSPGPGRPRTTHTHPVSLPRPCPAATSTPGACPCLTAGVRGGPLGHLPAPAAPGLRRPPGTIRPASAPSRPLLVPHGARRNAPGAPHPPAARWRGQLPPGPGPVPPRPRSPLWLRTKMAAKGRTPRAACRDTLREGPHRRAAPIEPE